MTSPGRGYEVAISRANRELLERLTATATGEGRRAEFIAALRTAVGRMESDPEAFGEEVYDLTALRLTIRLGVVIPVVVEFGVYADRRLVFVRTFRYVSPD